MLSRDIEQWFRDPLYYPPNVPVVVRQPIGDASAWFFFAVCLGLRWARGNEKGLLHEVIGLQ